MKYYRMLNPKKKIIIHLHGTKIRGRWNEYKDLKYADQIIVSTPDLLEGSPEGTEYLPNPVDEELILNIKQAMKGIPKERKAFHVDRFATDKAIEYAAKYDLELVVFDRDKTPLPHAEFLAMVGKYRYFINVERSSYLGNVAKHQYYIDVKRDYPGSLYENKVLETYSLTGLEALALGCNVINWDGKIRKRLPHEHRSENIVKKLHGIYQELLG